MENMDLKKDFDLTDFSTFRVPAKADFFFEAENLDKIKDLLKQNHFRKILILGLGANILFTQDFDGLVIKNNLKGVRVLEENDTSVILEVASGENWHDLVTFTVDHNWSGIENLALIPSTVGAAVTQNIAAYGQNLEDIFESLEALDLESLEVIKFTKQDCQFAYRDSIFKKADHKKFFITQVRLILSKTPAFSTTYRSRYESLESQLKDLTPPYTPKQIYQAVVNLRTSKLPDWTKIPTAGSFFRNPIVTKEKFQQLSTMMTELQSYPVEKLTYDETPETDLVKIPAGRLLDELGWKGKKVGKVGTFEKNALVIVNLGGATGQEILEFSQLMQKDCLEKYGVELIPEVNII